MPQTELVNLLRVFNHCGLSLNKVDFNAAFSISMTYFEKRFDAYWCPLGWPKIKHLQETYLKPIAQNEMLCLGDMLVVWLQGPIFKSQTNQNISWAEAIIHICSSDTLAHIDNQNPDNQDIANMLWLLTHTLDIKGRK